MSKKTGAAKKVKMIGAGELADRMELRVREYCFDGKDNEALVTLKAPGTSDEDRKLLGDFARRTGLKNVPQGRDRKRYWRGHCHWMVVYKRKDFEKAKAKDEPMPSEEEVSAIDRDESDEMREMDAQEESASVRQLPRPPRPDDNLKQGLSRVADLAEQLMQELRRLAAVS